MATGRIEQLIDLVVTGLKDVKAAETAVNKFDGRKAKATVDVDTKGAEGSVGKLKSLGGDALGFIKDNAASMAMGAAGALAGFAVKAVGDFQDVALAAGDLRDSLGLTAEEASRWQEVAGDLGISNQTLESTIGKMNKTLGATPGVFKALGVEVAKNSSGATDVNATFLNVIDTLHNIRDPAARAAAATKLLGKSWQDSSELITMGADNVRDSLAGVDDQKVISDKQIAQARKFRDTMDNLHDKIEDVSIVVGEELVPVLSDAAETVTSVIGPLQKLKSGFDSLTDAPVIKQIYDNFAPWRQLPTRIGQVQDAWDGLYDVFTGEDINASVNLEPTTAAVEAQAAAVPELTAAYEAAADPMKRYADLQKEAADQAERVAGILNDQADALNAQVDAATKAADAQLAENNALGDFAEALKNAKGHTDEVRDAAISLAKAHQATAEAQAAANGQTLTATQKLDALNDGLLTTAATAKGPARQAILDYIGSVNQIPPEKMTEIQAAVAAGDLETARRLLNEASAPRTAAITADANTAAATRELDQLTKDRTVLLIPHVGGPPIRFANGGTVGPGGGIAGEAGPEFISTPSGQSGLLTGAALVPPRTRVTSVRRTRAMLGGAFVTAAPINVIVNSAVVGDRWAVERAVRRATRDGVRLAGRRL